MSPLVILLAAAAAPVIPPQPQLTEQIAEADTALFTLYFAGCDAARMRAMVTPDVEFYHDKGGMIAHDADGLVADYMKECEAKKAPDAWRSRRELVRSSLAVDPVPGHGAIETGEHLFYERKGEGPEKLVGRARFAIVWKLDPDGWKMSRALSYSHEPVK
ncbi:MAG: nuclear transport factor 2 family protein [Sphingomicrobium sp.]